MNKPLPARLAELERLLIQQAEELRQKDTQLRLIEETEAFLRTALARAEEKVEEGEREIERLRAQLEKLRRMLFGTRSEKLRRQVEEAEALLKQQENESDRKSGREGSPPTKAIAASSPVPGTPPPRNKPTGACRNLLS